MEDLAALFSECKTQWGTASQCVVCIEELAELQKELTKFLRGYFRYEKMAEELADAKLMLEQIIFMLGLNSQVRKYTDRKIKQLKKRLAESGDNKWNIQRS